MADLPRQFYRRFVTSASLAVLAVVSFSSIPLIGCGSSKPESGTQLSESPKPVADTKDSNGTRPVPMRQPGAMSFQVADEGMVSVSEDLAATDGGSAAAAAPAVSLKYASWEEILAKVKSVGKPVVVDVWSLACEPCMKEFPGLVRLQQEYGDKLTCVSVNVDYDGRRTHPPERYGTDVIRFLTFHDAELTNFICSTPNDLVFEALEIPSIPAVLLFDSEGNEVTRFVDAGETRGFTYEGNIFSVVAELLGQSVQQDQTSDQVEQAPSLEQPGTESSTDTTSDSSENPNTPANQ